MVPNLPTYFAEDVRLEIIDETSYTDNEIYTFARKSINRIAPLIRSDTTTIDGASIWDFTVSDAMDHDYWEIIKWSTIVDMMKHYKNLLITQGIGVSIGIGSERIDTKSLLLTVKDTAAGASKTLKEKILAYNMSHKLGVAVDLYIRNETW